MKINAKRMKNISLSIEMIDRLKKGDIKMIKQWMKDTKIMLPDYVDRMVGKAERDLQIGIVDIYKLTATYCTSYRMPVITIVAGCYDRSPGSDLNYMFVEAFVSDECDTLENRYALVA